jgi:hypothetical protein
VIGESRQIGTLGEFRRRAQSLGGKLSARTAVQGGGWGRQAHLIYPTGAATSFIRTGPDAGLTAWASPADGRNCDCCPGLWVSAQVGERVVVAHFGRDFRIGGSGLFTREEQVRWKILKKDVGL